MKEKYDQDLQLIGRDKDYERIHNAVANSKSYFRYLKIGGFQLEKNEMVRLDLSKKPENSKNPTRKVSRGGVEIFATIVTYRVDQALPDTEQSSMKPCKIVCRREPSRIYGDEVFFANPHNIILHEKRPKFVTTKDLKDYTNKAPSAIG